MRFAKSSIPTWKKPSTSFVTALLFKAQHQGCLKVIVASIMKGDSKRKHAVPRKQKAKKWLGRYTQGAIQQNRPGRHATVHALQKVRARKSVPLTSPLNQETPK